MKILSENPKIEIWNDDCLNVLKEMPDKSVDLVLTDPPYNIGKDYGNESDKQPEDIYWKWLKKIGIECERVLKQKGWCLVINGVSKISGTIESFNKLNHIWTACWYAPNKVSHSVYGFNLWQPIMIFRKGETEWLKLRDFYSFTTGQEKNGHPTPKPLRLIEKLVYDFSKDNDTILDPFMGSGTTGVACANLNRNFIGIEISEKYCQIAEERIMRVINQQKLF